MKPGIITQARMGSTRLPGKVMKTINGRPLLEYHLDRARKTNLTVIVATTNQRDDDVIVEFCKEQNIPFLRGSEEDVLSRYVNTAEHFEINPVLRITSDCPLIDPDILMEGLEQFKNMDVDYLRTDSESSLPHGLDFQIASLQALQEANRETTNPEDREHVVPFLEKKEHFEKKYFQNDSVDDHWNVRITVDYPEDFQLMRLLIEKYNAHETNMSGIVDLIENNSDLKEAHSKARSRAHQLEKN